MGITHSDFRRIFPRLAEGSESFVMGAETTVDWSGGRRLTVYLSGEKVRKIALLRIPFVDIRFVFEGFFIHEAESFMGRFDLAFHKGGG